MSPRPRKAKEAFVQHDLCAPTAVLNPAHGADTAQFSKASLLVPQIVGIDQAREACQLGPQVASINLVGKACRLGSHIAGIDQAGEACQLGPHIAGIDEAGRGCLAGPVVAAAVILPANLLLPGLNDSKQLSAKQRDLLAPQIKSCALAWSVGLSWPREIEHCNILQATFHAMSRAVCSLRLPPQHLLIDGNKIIPLPVLQHYCRTFLPSQQAIVGGDALEAAISAASILAKTYRDHLMQIFHARHPAYGFDRHKGYGTKEHLQCLREHGPCPEHRRTFAGVLPPTAPRQNKGQGRTPMQGSLC